MDHLFYHHNLSVLQSRRLTDHALHTVQPQTKMTEQSYFALVGIEPLSLQELLTCQAQRLGLSPPEWPVLPEPEPPPPFSSVLLPNLDTSKLTLVECVRTPLVGPYRTTYGLNSAPSPLFHIPLDAIVQGVKGRS
jgi:hypothetical protein